MKKDIEIINQISEIERVSAFIEEMGEELHLSSSMIMNTNLILLRLVVSFR